MLLRATQSAVLLRRAQRHWQQVTRPGVHSAVVGEGRRWFWWSGEGGDGDGKDDDKPAKRSGSAKEEKKENPDDSSGELEGEGRESSEAENIIDVDVTPSSSASSLATVGWLEDAPQIPSLVALPLDRRPLFPGFMHPVFLEDPATIDHLNSLLRTGAPYVGVFLRKDGAESPERPRMYTGPGGSETDESGEGGGPGLHDDTLITQLSDVHEIGTLAKFHVADTGSGMRLITFGQRRIRLKGSVVDQGPPLIVDVDHLRAPKFDVDGEMYRATKNELVSTLRDIFAVNPMFKQAAEALPFSLDMGNPTQFVDSVAALTTASPLELQAVLETLDVQERMDQVLLLLKKELEVAKLQAEIKQSVETKIGEEQKKYFLMEQLKSIKKELGMEKDDKEAVTAKFVERLVDKVVPEDAQAVIDEELNKFAALEKNSSEFNVTRNYLDWLTSVPWGISSEENFDIDAAQEILDEDHYGMKDVKDRILEIIAVGKLKGDVGQGKIICLSGPPGVGKTSIGKSIARSLNRKFFRFSVGGLSDVAEIKGHRRTYVGAMPGKIIQGLKATESSNPLVLIDEIDKLGRGYQGDPASALLELLDPSQNSSFMDHYLDVPVDLSQVLFICTANTLDTIPGPLLDRMEIIQLPGYDTPEKVEICRRYLEPRVQDEMGLAGDGPSVPRGLGMDDSAINSLIRWYCREAGVRNLQKHVEKAYRKIALRAVRSSQAELQDDTKWRITEASLPDLVGKAPFTSDRLYEQGTPPGVVMGLAWTSMGGSALYIEAVGTGSAGNIGDAQGSDMDGFFGGFGKKEKPKTGSESDAHRSPKPASGGGALQTTGMMGDVMKESTRIARTVAKSKLARWDPTNTFFDSADIHMHVPEGATPKDGPSAGITMVTSLMSLALDRPVMDDLAMTGEVSLTGKVLPVGGIREKTIAARRTGVSTLILPDANRRDWEELPDYLKEGLSVHFAQVYDDVFDIAFGEDRYFDL